MKKTLFLSQLLDLSNIESQSKEFEKYLEQGGTVRELLRLPKSYLEKLYASGYLKFQNKDYRPACQLFALLTFLAPDEKKYWKSLGAAHVCLEEYRAAIESYSTLALLDPQNPEPHFFIAFCQKKLGGKKEAIDSLDRANKMRQEKWGLS